MRREGEIGLACALQKVHVGENQELFLTGNKQRKRNERMMRAFIISPTAEHRFIIFNFLFWRAILMFL
jgi:hypothetical protein